MPELRRVQNAEEIGLSSLRLERAFDKVRRTVDDGTTMGAAIQVARNGFSLETRTYGRRRLNESSPVNPDTIFLAASVTKPVTSTAAMLLVEGGDLRLDDPVSSIIPEFTGEKREKILIRHLLTHTSGLPDQLPENGELRSKHASLDEFIQRTYKTPILFEPATNISYQSSGMIMLMDIVQHVTGLPLREFMLRQIFEPLGMNDTSLGVDPSKAERVSQIRLPHGRFQYGEPAVRGASITGSLQYGGADDNWNWNSSYWRSLGSPWGGMVSTTDDLIKLLTMFLNHGILGDRRVMSPETARAMTSNQVERFLTIPEEVRHSNPWGFGWELKSPINSRFGDLVSSRAFGHAGATGTLVWADPETSLACVILTNQPYDEVWQLLAKFSNALVGSLIN